MNKKPGKNPAAITWPFSMAKCWIPKGYLLQKTFGEMMGEILGNVWGHWLTICHHQNGKWRLPKMRLPKILTYKLDVYENHNSGLT